MKHFHILMAVLTIIIFIYQGFKVATNQPAKLPRKIMLLSHVVYLLLLIAGVSMAISLIKLGAGAALYWLILKLILFVIAIALAIFSTRNNTPPRRAKIGMSISAICYVAIVTLAITKPTIF